MTNISARGKKPSSLSTVSKLFSLLALSGLSLYSLSGPCLAESKAKSKANKPPMEKPQAAPGIKPLKLAFELVGSAYSQPVQLLSSPKPNSPLYVVEQGGKILPLGPESEREPIFDISEIAYQSEQTGLLGVAFHPQFAENGKLFVHYTKKRETVENRISEFTLSGSSAKAFQERALIRLNMPQAKNLGGHLVFGPDNFLYIGFGDGGNIQLSQSRSSQWGKILRIDIDQRGRSSEEPFLSPTSNPYYNSKIGDDTVFAYGLRNPSSLSFDPLSRELWVADSGEGEYQEINLVTSGSNYGWSVFDSETCRRTKFDCMSLNPSRPLAAYDKSQGNSVVAGYVYHGSELDKDLGNKFIYADGGSGRIWALEKTSEGTYSSKELAKTDYAISAIGRDDQGELYIADYLKGNIYKIVAAK